MIPYSEKKSHYPFTRCEIWSFSPFFSYYYNYISYRRYNKKKMAALERRFSEPSQEFKVLKNLQKRIANDMAQRQIIIIFLSDKHGDEQDKKGEVYFALKMKK